jgi:ribonuclease P protein component
VVTPAGRLGLPKGARILRPADFARIYERRCSTASGPLVLYAAPRLEPTGDSRVGLSVSRRIGNAVVRNRWKRRLREAFRQVRHRLPPATDYVIVVRGGDPGTGAEAARRAESVIEALAARVTGRPGYPAPPQPPSDGRGPQRRRGR